jgi:hypothetical protein
MVGKITEWLYTNIYQKPEIVELFRTLSNFRCPYEVVQAAVTGRPGLAGAAAPVPFIRLFGRSCILVRPCLLEQHLHDTVHCCIKEYNRLTTELKRGGDASRRETMPY